MFTSAIINTFPKPTQPHVSLWCHMKFNTNFTFIYLTSHLTLAYGIPIMFTQHLNWYDIMYVTKDSRKRVIRHPIRLPIYIHIWRSIIDGWISYTWFSCWLLWQANRRRHMEYTVSQHLTCAVLVHCKLTWHTISMVLCLASHKPQHHPSCFDKAVLVCMIVVSVWNNLFTPMTVWLDMKCDGKCTDVLLMCS